MTFDGSSTKMWHNGEYESLNAVSYEKCKKEHDAHCQFNNKLEVEYAT